MALLDLKKKHKYYNLSYLISEGRRGHNLGSKMIIAALKKIVKKNLKLEFRQKVILKIYLQIKL